MNCLLARCRYRRMDDFGNEQCCRGMTLTESAESCAQYLQFQPGNITYVNPDSLSLPIDDYGWLQADADKVIVSNYLIDRDLHQACELTHQQAYNLYELLRFYLFH